MKLGPLLKENPVLGYEKLMAVLEKSTPNATRERIHALLDYLEDDELIPPTVAEDEYSVVDVVSARALQIGMIDLDVGKSGMRRIADLFVEDEPAPGEYNFMSAVRDYDAGKQVWITFLPVRGPRNYTAHLEPKFGDMPDDAVSCVQINFNKVVDDALAVL
jgi:hypothetical protein